MYLQTVTDNDDVGIRLVKTTTLYSGIIELRIRYEWRSVCHDKWTDEDAQVACRSLELPSSGKLCNFAKELVAQLLVETV